MLKPSTCNGCVLEDKHHLFLPPQGTGKNKVMVFNHTPEMRDMLSVDVLHSATLGGSMFDTALAKARLEKDDFSLTNLTSCFPPTGFLAGTSWEHAVLDSCAVHRHAAVEAAQPRAILGLGGMALRELTGFSGRKQGISTMRGYVVPSKDYCRDAEGNVFAKELLDINTYMKGEYFDIPVMTTYDPTLIRLGKTQFINVFLMDILRTVRLATSVEPHTFVHPSEMDYKELKTVEELEAFLARVNEDPNRLLTYDIETSTSAGDLEDEIDTKTTASRIISVQFSLAVGTGVFVRFEGELIRVIRDIFATQNPKAGFNNYLFDDRILLASGTGLVINGVIHDLMCAWRHLQRDLEANLQYVASFYGMPFPWKHLYGEYEELYGCADVDAPYRIAEGLFPQLAQRGIKEGYERHIIELQRALRKVEIRGVPVDNTKLQTYGDEILVLQKQVYGEIQDLYPDEVQKVQVYKTWPKAVRAWLLERGLVPKQTAKTQGLVDLMNIQLPNPLPTGEKKGRTGVWIFKDGLIGIRKPFLPGGKDQIIAYIKYMGLTNKKYKVPTKFKGGDETTERKEIDRLIVKTDDKLLKKVLEYRGYTKLHSTYVIGWTPNAAGTVHTQFTHRPATGQLSSRNPNIQNGPKSTALADRWRGCLVATRTKLMCEIDYSAFHVLTTGFCADDETYMRLARIDPHSFVASHFEEVKCDPINPNDSDDDIAAQTAWVKAHHKFERNKQAKPGILGYGFGLGVNNFYEQNREHFRNKAHVEKLFDLLDSLFPKAAKWRWTVRREAHKQGYLTGEHGYIRHFGEVFRFDARKGQLVPGMDSEKAIAFRPANLAFGHFKDIMLTLEQKGYNERYGWINTVHDSLWYHCERDLVEEMLVNVTNEMIVNSKKLVSKLVPDGLWCGVEAEIGPDMNALQTVLSVDYNKAMHFDRELARSIING